MNGRKAKEIRRRVYGEGSKRGAVYVGMDIGSMVNPHHNRHFNRPIGHIMIMAVGLRGIYRVMKRPDRVGMIRTEAMRGRKRSK